MKTLIIIPTYNESQDIKKLLEQIFSLQEEFHVLIVDDNSPDGTGEIVEKMKSEYKKLDIIHRPAKLGLGTAYIEGFKYAIENEYDLIFQMDADLSHRIEHLHQFMEAIKKYDMVIGSRYIDGISIIHWDLKRLLMSKFANWYTRKITGLSVTDSTSGFRCYKREVLDYIQVIKSCPRVEGVKEILLPGELENVEYKKRNKNGIPLDLPTWRSLKNISRNQHVKLPKIHHL